MPAEGEEAPSTSRPDSPDIIQIVPLDGKKRRGMRQGMAAAGSADTILHGRFYIPPEEARALLGSQPAPQFLRSLIAPASMQARPPISNFKVGYAVQASFPLLAASPL